jgi:hypothetical protein
MPYGDESETTLASLLAGRSRPAHRCRSGQSEASATSARHVRASGHDRNVPGPLAALETVLDRFDSFHRLGALYREGGERAFRGWLVSGFFQAALGWPWQAVVQGESLDVLLLDWADRPVVYIETKTPTAALQAKHRREMEGRLDRWGSLQHLVLTNGRLWERFDGLSQPIVPAASYAPGMHAGEFEALVAPLRATRYRP